jgi:hypothetical protein
MTNCKEKTQSDERQMTLPGVEYLPVTPVRPAEYEHREHQHCEYCARELASVEVCATCARGW